MSSLGRNVILHLLDSLHVCRTLNHPGQMECFPSLRLEAGGLLGHLVHFTAAWGARVPLGQVFVPV